MNLNVPEAAPSQDFFGQQREITGSIAIALTYKDKVVHSNETQNVQDKMNQLNDMGYHDYDRNLQCVRKANGDLMGALNYLVEFEAPSS